MEHGFDHPHGLLLGDEAVRMIEGRDAVKPFFPADDETERQAREMARGAAPCRRLS